MLFVILAVAKEGPTIYVDEPTVRAFTEEEISYRIKVMPTNANEASLQLVPDLRAAVLHAVSSAR
jgi:hypothetical protein